MPHRISELARLLNLSTETIRYYQRIGLLEAPPASGDGRQYSEKEIKQLNFIRAFQKLGFSLAKVASLSKASRGPKVDCRQIQESIDIQLKEIRAQRSALELAEVALLEASTLCQSCATQSCRISEQFCREPNALFENPNSSQT